jgi:hypothetical protein
MSREFVHQRPDGNYAIQPRRRAFNTFCLACFRFLRLIFRRLGLDDYILPQSVIFLLVYGFADSPGPYTNSLKVFGTIAGRPGGASGDGDCGGWNFADAR